MSHDQPADRPQEDTGQGHSPPSDLNVTWTVVVGFVGVIAVLVFIVGIQILFHRAESAQYEQKVVNEVPAQLAQLRAQQIERIHTYRLVSQKDARAAIPVERAMELIARDPSILATIPSPTTQADAAASNATTGQPDGAVRGAQSTQGGPR